MKKGYIIGGILVSSLIGTCSLSSLIVLNQVTHSNQTTYLNSFEGIVRLGHYDIDARILLSENPDKTNMRISAYFKYPAQKIMSDGCVFEVKVDLEGQTPQRYPDHVVGTEYEQNFSIEKISATSVNDSVDVNDFRRLILILYNEPVVEQTYILSVKSKSDNNAELCQAKETIIHKIGYHRSNVIMP